MSSTSMFAMAIPGRPLVTEFVPVDETHLVAEVPAPADITQFSISLLSPAIPEGTGVGVYYAAPAEDGSVGEWNYVGQISLASPTAFFRASWNGHIPADTPVLHVVLSLEAEAELAEKVTADQVEERRTLDSVRGIVNNLYTYMTSFAGSAAAAGPDMLVIPANFIDKWMERFTEKHRRQPFFWMEKQD